MTPEIIGSVLRSIIIAIGGGFITNGYLDQSQLDTIAGGAAVAVGLAWSIIQKLRAAKKPPAV